MNTVIAWELVKVWNGSEAAPCAHYMLDCGHPGWAWVPTELGETVQPGKVGDTVDCPACGSYPSIPDPLAQWQPLSVAL